MKTATSPRVRVAATVATAATFFGVVLITATPASATTSPVAPRTDATVTADALPTTQIDGVAWSQTIIGNTVYVGGSFTTARPAGAAPGTSTTPRANMLAYNLTTGQLITTFAPTFNAQVLDVTSSPDGSRLYVGGDFTSISGVNKYRIAALNPTTGALISAFNPTIDYKVKSIVATGTTVYVGGGLSVANGVARGRAAAFSAATGALLNWNPNADDTINAMVMTPDGSKIIVGGSFNNIGGGAATGLAALDPVTGTLLPWNAVNTVKDSGVNAAITSLNTDGVSIFGTGYVFGAGGNFEGTFSADPTTGNINFMEDCHGDTYDTYATGDVVYTVSHAHYCGNLGGFPETDTRRWQRTVAFTNHATGTLSKEHLNYTNFEGQPSPSIVNWFPDLPAGTYTGQVQAAWTVTGTSQYVVEGGEFPSVNGIAQQGLVRFAVKPIAPSKMGPVVTGALFMPTVTTLSPGTARVSFQSNWDRDDKTLTYKVVRNSNTAAPVYTVTADSTFWNRPGLGFTDTGLVAGTQYRYRLYVSDPSGNTVAGDTFYYTEPATGAVSSYGAKLIADGASIYWPLDEAAGNTVFDNAGYENGTASAGVTRGAAGAIAGDTASTFAGTSTSTLSSGTTINAPDTFTLSAFFKTATTTGGKIIGFGSNQTGNSKYYDRQIYLDNSGKVYFGVAGNGNVVINTATAFNDGQWHQVVGTVGPGGMTLYVDGVRIGVRTDVTKGALVAGFWRVGGDSLANWTGKPSSNYLNGSIDEVAIFPTALSRSTILAEYAASGRSTTSVTPPSDRYGAAVFNDDPELYWRLNDTAATGTTVNSAGPYAGLGDYVGGVTLGAPGALSGVADPAVTFNGSDGFAVSRTSAVNPTLFSLQAWFKTSTTKGGKIIGLGSTRTGTAGSYDRHVYMQNDGKLVYGVSNGTRVLITTPTAYNDNVWHQVVATLSSTGMKLYVDGTLVGTQGPITASSYTGYWRVGGGATWGSTSQYFAGSIDEVAVYYSELSAQQISTDYSIGSGSVANVLPTASFTTSPTDLSVGVDGSASADSDGAIASYAWNFGDGTTASGAIASHRYAAAGTYTIALTVTDNRGGIATVTKSVTVVAANVNPNAAFTASATGLTAGFDASGSADPDGTLATYAWDFGDGQNGAGVTASHTYAATGDYSVTLVVTDNRGGTGSATQPITVTAPAVNAAPSAAFTSLTTNLTATFDATASTDGDGSVSSYAWTFGDGSPAGSGATVTHSYATGATFVVTLVVTDNQGATGTVSHSVTTTAPVVAADAFARAVPSGWGSADTGGGWTVTGTAANYKVESGLGKQTLTKAGSATGIYLNSVSARDVTGTVDISLDSVPTGGGTYVALAERRIGTSDYRVRARFQPTATTLQLMKVVNGVETVLRTVTVPGVTYASGDVYRLKLQVSGSGTTTLNAKLWKVGTTEPAAVQNTITDTEPSLQAAGGVGLGGYLSGSSTVAPVTVFFDNMTVVNN